jgi:hypothetical protein
MHIYDVELFPSGMQMEKINLSESPCKNIQLGQFLTDNLVSLLILTFFNNHRPLMVKKP